MDEIKPSRWYYALAALIFITGEACFFLYIFSNLGGFGEGLTQVVVPEIVIWSFLRLERIPYFMNTKAL